jgi:2-polyprenyl-3-methyl-5-hydroxy-6-metoxy-1,4-benzoquinol methylase
MRLDIVAENPVEQIALWSGLMPRPLMIAFWGMGYARCLMTAIRMGIFETLSRGPLTAADLAAELGADPLGTDVLLSALNGMGFLRKDGDSYRNSRVVDRWLVGTSAQSVVDAVRFFEDIWDQLDLLTEAVRTGEMRRFHDAPMPDGFWERYMRGLATMARPMSGMVARKVRLPAGASRLLDVGGGHGMFSVGMCRRCPGLRAEVIDLPDAAKHGREIVANEGFGDRVTYREGDMRVVDWGTGYDGVLIFNVLHNSTEEEGRSLLRRAFESLKPGGTVAIMDSEHRPRAGNNSFIGGYNELFFFLVSGTRAWPEATMRGWIEQAGFTSIRTTRLLALPEVIICGTRPA